MIKTEGGEGDGKDNETWHSDITFADEPPIGAILQGVELPSTGGDTLFSSMYAAYERLSEPIKRAIEGLEAWHDGIPYFQTYVRYMGFEDADERIAKMRVNYPGVAHPIVRKIPEHYMSGWSPGLPRHCILHLPDMARQTSHKWTNNNT